MYIKLSWKTVREGETQKNFVWDKIDGAFCFTSKAEIG